MRHSEQIDAIAASLAAAQGEMPAAPLDGKNPHFGSKYATLAALVQTSRPVLARHGLAIVQGRGADGGIETTILHTSGQWITADGVPMRPVKDDPQGIASAITYARRYGLAAAVGLVADDDDDGNAATAGNGPQRPQGASTPPAGVGHAQGGDKPASVPGGVNAGHTTAGIPPRGTVDPGAHKTDGVLTGVIQEPPARYDRPTKRGAMRCCDLVLRDARGIDWRVTAWHDAADEAAKLAAGDSVEAAGLWDVYKGATKLDASSVVRLSPPPVGQAGDEPAQESQRPDGCYDDLPF